jgi:lysozyme family protein
MDLFQQALKFVLKWEGGYVNHPNDPGGATNKGITQRTYDSYLSSKGKGSIPVKKITDSEVEDIYRKYWTDGKCDKMRPSLAVAHFDACVNSGVYGAAKILQRAVQTKPDGIIGAITISLLDMATAKDLIDSRRKHYEDIIAKNPKLETFRKGWNNRLDDLIRFVVGFL